VSSAKKTALATSRLVAGVGLSSWRNGRQRTHDASFRLREARKLQLRVDAAQAGLDRFLSQGELIRDLSVVVRAVLRDDVAVQQHEDAALSGIQVQRRLVVSRARLVPPPTPRWAKTCAMLAAMPSGAQSTVGVQSGTYPVDIVERGRPARVTLRLQALCGSKSRPVRGSD